MKPSQRVRRLWSTRKTGTATDAHVACPPPTTLLSALGLRPKRVAVAVVVVGFLGSAAAVADSEAVARRHAAKANQLSAKNKCRSAVPEFTRAYKILKDPALLFNRAECLRKLGRDAEALKDYEQFLTELPQAPNHAAVEARIASLRGAVGAGGGTAAAMKPEQGTPAEKEAAGPTGKPGQKRADAPAVPAATAAAMPARPAETAALAPAAPSAAKAAVGNLAAPTAPVAKPSDKAAPPGAPTAPAAAKPAEKAPTTPAAKPDEKAAPAPEAPARRAKKWTD
jgi:tetratricopeptide (TPR) repeat protein